MAIEDLDVRSKPGFITLRKASGPPERYPISELIRSADVPNLTISSLSLLTELADILSVIVKTLIDRDILDEDFYDGHDLNSLVERLEALNADWSGE